MKSAKENIKSFAEKLVESVAEPKPELQLPPEPDIATERHCFLYMRMQTISTLPDLDGDLYLCLTQNGKIVYKLDEKNPTDNTFELYDENSIWPTFSIIVAQDSIDELNIFSDNPLMLTLYLHQIKMCEEEMSNEEYAEEESCIEEYHLAIAQGQIDLFQFFRTKRIQATLTTAYLYGIEAYQDIFLSRTLKTTWHIYSTVPLLPKLKFSNVLFITLDTICNVSEELLEQCEDLVIELSFKATHTNEENEFVVTPICKYSCFQKKTKANQNTNICWESTKDKTINNIGCLSTYTGQNFGIYKMYKNWFYEEDANYGIRATIPELDLILACNSVHRFILTNEIAKILEQAIGFEQQKIIVQLYKIDEPENILLQGTLDPSILLYPYKTSCKFAVVLRSTAPPVKNIQATKNKKKGGSIQQQPPPKDVFALITFNFILPVSDCNEDITNYNENDLKRNRLRMIGTIKNKYEEIDKNYGRICTIYKDFYIYVDYIITQLLKTEPNDISNVQSFFCCEMGNLNNIIMKVISCDFSRRFKTKTNLEFTNLMTNIYNELEQRIYDHLETIDLEQRKRFPKLHLRDDVIIIIYMNNIKYMYECGMEHIGKKLYEKLEQEYKKNAALSFYTYVYNVEKQRFDKAEEYQNRSENEKVFGSEFLEGLIKIYIMYIKDLEEQNNAVENLLRTLTIYAEKNNKEISCWILLYSLYKMHNYKPGMSYAYWKYSNLYDNHGTQLPKMPISLWKMYNNYPLMLNSQKTFKFNEVMDLFVSLGLYKFGEIVFTGISAQVSDMERYLVFTTFKILLKEVDKKYALKKFPTDKHVNGAEKKAFQLHLNGCYEEVREKFDSAQHYYGEMLHVKDITNYGDFQISILRYAIAHFKNNSFVDTIHALEMCTDLPDNHLIVNFFLGKAYYKCNRLSTAIKYLSKSTDNRIHLPDVWAYLAIANLKLKQNYKAIECWKYATLNPNFMPSEDVYVELEKINFMDICLWVERVDLCRQTTKE